MFRFKNLLTLLVGMSTFVSARYQLVQDYSGVNFYRGFDFFTQTDPTHGHVQFKSLAEANATGIAGFVNGGNATNAIFMGVDTTQIAPQGRASVRVTSKQSFDRFLLIADIVHMPGGICGTWPAFWTVGRNWPYDGEIDIIEGVNDQQTNYMTLHTSASLLLSDPSSSADPSNSQSNSFAGKISTPNCAIDAPNQPDNAGCAIQDPNPLTYGTAFNANAGGLFAVERLSTSIRMWFFPRGKFPADIVNRQPSPNPEWGRPRSVFQFPASAAAAAGAASTTNTTNSSTETVMNLDAHFRAQQIVFDTTFCGAWAGKVWNQSESCRELAGSCEEFVRDNPRVFAEAYWAVNSLLVFQDDNDGVLDDDGVARRHLGRKKHWF